MRPTKTALVIIALTSLALFGCEREAVLETGRLAIESEPRSGAKISLNGRGLDERTDATIDGLEPGVYQVELFSAPGEGADTTQTGAAEVEVEAGKLARVVVRLNPMESVPAATEDGVRPRTRGQKSIFDFYAALSEGDPGRAYAHLGTERQRAAGYLRGFTKTWSSVEQIDVTAVRLESVDPSTTLETSIITLNIFEATETTPLPPPDTLSMKVTTTEKAFGGPGLPLILELGEATDSPSPL